MATLHNVRDRRAIYLEIESQIPSVVSYSLYNHATGPITPLRNTADGNCARKNNTQQNLAGEGVSRFHGEHYTRKWFFDEC
jgi:hypothetical protein